MVQCVVFNSSHEPLAVVSAERGLILMLEGKAIILDELPGRKFRTVKTEYPIPTSIVLKEYRKTGGKYYGMAPLNQRNLFLRDNHTCVYCERHLLDLRASEYLTRDHFLPLSRKGSDTWDNVVTACSTCNHRKDNRTHPELVTDYEHLEHELIEAMERKDVSAIKRLTPRVDLSKSLARRPQPKVPTVFEIMTKRSKRGRYQR